jgi:FMN phosphatase YigB (HAD superfamily)
MEKVIFFDIDDTLIETFGNSYLIFNKIANIYWFKIDKIDFIKKYIEWDYVNNINYFFDKYDNFENINTQYNKFKKKYRKKILVEKWFFEKLKYLWYKIWILTNWPKNKTYEKLNLIWLNTNDKLIFHWENLINKKPNSDLFLQILWEIWQTDEIIFVWDSIMDYLVTKWTNVKFFAVLTWYTSKKEFIENWLREKNIITHLSNLCNLI